MPVLIDITGKRFGRLVVISRAPRDGHGNDKWDCRCDCGKPTTVLGYSLRSGETKSCGCLSREITSKRATTHGLGTKAPEYEAWKGLSKRCANENTKCYNRYGGRGVTVCNRWRGVDGYPNFLSDMGKKPTAEHSLDRINNDGNYEPNNCRWATKAQQARNTGLRVDNISGIKGVTWDKLKCKWQASISVNSKSIHLGYSTNIEEVKAARLAGEKKYWNDDD